METNKLNDVKFPCIILAIKEDYFRCREFFSRLFDYLPISKLIYVCPGSVKNVFDEDKANNLFKDYPVEFVDEQKILPIDEFKPIYDGLLAKSHCSEPSSVFWYYQQFLKMAYATICEEDYYLSWDSDTIPLRKIDMVSADGLPYLDIKSECQKEYFITIDRLFGFSKIIEKSFISEHMLFKKEYMLDIIKEIEATDFVGTHFSEKILSALGSDNIQIGFSEFETYGTWVGMHHPSAYKLRNWKSIRNTSFFIDVKDITQDDLSWMGGTYDAATFERYQETEPQLNELYKNPRYREKLTFEQFYISVLESGAMGEYNSNGTVLIDGFIAPT